MNEITLQQAITTETIPQLNINKLRKNHYINDGGYNEGTFAAKDGDPSLELSIDLREGKSIMNIKYEVINGTEIMDYDIKIIGVPSNLGKGQNLYFECPVSGKMAKILYYCIKTHRYISREAYPQRIYYESESKSKLDRLWAQNSDNDIKLLENFIKMERKNYGSQSTKINNKIGWLLKNQHKLSLLINRWILK